MSIYWSTESFLNNHLQGWQRMVQKIENFDVACFDGTVDVIWHYVNKMGYNAREICHTAFPHFWWEGQKLVKSKSELQSYN